MTLANYTELSDAIAERAVAFTGPAPSYYPEFIMAAESKMNYGFVDPSGRYNVPALRVADMEESEDLTFAGDGSAALPDDYLEWRNVDFVTSYTTGLGYSTPGALNYDYPTSYAGTPAAFTIKGGSVHVRPSGTGTFPFAYYAKIPALTADDPTNWLLTKHPFVYLYGALLEAALFSGEDWAIAQYGGLFSGQVKGLNNSDKNARWARGTARVMGPTP